MKLSNMFYLMLCSKPPPNLSCLLQFNISHSELMGFTSPIQLQKHRCRSSKCYLDGSIKVGIQDGAFMHKVGPQLMWEQTGHLLLSV